MTAPGVIRRNWRLKIAAFALTVLLWASIRVGAVSQQDLPDVPVRVENDDPDWVPQGLPSPATVRLGLTGPARELFGVAVDRPIVVVPMDRVLSDDTVIILRSEWVRNADRPGVAIEDITPSTIRLQFERNEGASIPVSRRISGFLPDSLSFVAPIQLSPLFTNVRGPASAVDELEAIFTQDFDLGVVNGSGRFDVGLDTTGVGLRVTPNTVTLTISVAPTTERTLAARPVVLPDGAEGDLEVAPDSFAVTLRGAEVVLAGLDEASVWLEALDDPLLGELEAGGELYVPIQVQGLPDLVSGSAEPDSVLVRRAGGL